MSKDIETLLALLPEGAAAEIAALLPPQEKQDTPPTWWIREQRPAIPFRCPICLKECWKVEEIERSELDASNKNVRPYSMICKSSVWIFECGHSVERYPIEKEEEEVEEEE